MSTMSREPDAQATQIVAQAFQQWSAGQQQPAIESVRPYADEGHGWALAMIAWFLHQTGEPGWRSAIPYAENAVRAGYPLAANYVIGNMMNDPSLRAHAAELIKVAVGQGFQVDPIGYAQQAASQGDAVAAARFLTAPFAPYPLHPAGWDDLVAHARSATQHLADLEREGNQKREAVAQHAAEVEQLAGEVTNRIRTQTGQLFTLIQAATNRQAEAVFEDEASTLRAEERSLWRGGIAIVSVAAAIAVLPLLLHYLNIGPDFTSSNLLTAHFTSAASFAVVAGVMLARARGRDRARQRARDLTLALSTMFAYGGQIEDAAERGRFTYEMGRVVIESFLRADASQGSDESTSLLTALLARK